MNKRQLIQNLIMLGWEPAPYTPRVDDGFYLWKEYEITRTNELYNYIDYQPNDEMVFVTYEIYPNLESCRYCIWTEDNPYDVIWVEDDYETVLEKALADSLFTYPRQNK